jgi:hypothetical protein
LSISLLGPRGCLQVAFRQKEKRRRKNECAGYTMHGCATAGDESFAAKGVRFRRRVSLAVLVSTRLLCLITMPWHNNIKTFARGHGIRICYQRGHVLNVVKHIPSQNVPSVHETFGAARVNFGQLPPAVHAHSPFHSGTPLHPCGRALPKRRWVDHTVRSISDCIHCGSHVATGHSIGQ